MQRVLCIEVALGLAAVGVPAAWAQTNSATIDGMPGLVLRLKAGTLGLADGDRVWVWPNTADTGRSAIVGAGSPTYRANIVNGKGVVRLSRSAYDRFLIDGGGVTLTDWTIFIVHQTTDDCCFLGGTVGNLQLRIGEGGLNTLTGWDGVQGGVSSSTLAAPRTAWNAVEFRRHGPVLAFQEAGTSRGHARWDGTATFDQIGSLNGNPFLDGDIAEVLAFSRQLSISEEVSVYDYIRGEYAITPSIVPTSLVHTPPALPKLYSYLHWENAANINYRNLPIDRTHVYQFTDALVNPAFDVFVWAVGWKIPDPNATGYASLDLEVESPGLLPAMAADYAGDAWNTTDRDYIISLLDYARAARPGVKWGVYWHPLYDSLSIRNWATYSYATTTSDWFEAYSKPGNLVAVLGHADMLQPELYPHDRTETQADSNFVAAANLQLCHDINDFYVTPQVARETMAFVWVQVVPDDVGGGIVGEFLTEGELAQRFRAARQAGFDGIFIGGNAQAGYYTPAQWQDWADTTLTQALFDSGLANPCYANCDGSTVAPILNVLDFSCFLNKFASGAPEANCDGSTTVPVLNVSDFSCFLNKFAAGCS